MQVIIGTGGTAGHVFPALATAERLRDRLGAEVTFVGRAEGQEARLIPSAGYRLAPVAALPFRRSMSLDAVRAVLAALRAARQCRSIVRGADVVIGMGGYVSVPVSLAAWRERVPLVLHEQNAAPGLANRLAARWARAVALSFGEAAARFPRRVRAVITGNPVRETILRVRSERDVLKKEALGLFDLEPDRMTLVVFGGSQGALRINDCVAHAVNSRLLARSDLQLLWITGPAHHDEVRGSVQDDRGLVVRTTPFLERMELAYAVSDVAVCRAGATTVAELAVCGIPAILVPYPFATGGHQEANAGALERAGGAVVVPDGELTPEGLAAILGGLLDDEPRRESLRRSSAAFGRPGAADALADLAASVARAS